MTQTEPADPKWFEPKSNQTTQIMTQTEPANPKWFKPLHDSSPNLAKTNNAHCASTHLRPATATFDFYNAMSGVFSNL